MPSDSPRKLVSLDLPHFYTTHRDRLAKWLPEGFGFRKASPFHGTIREPEYFFLFDLPLLEPVASIFLEHAARKVVEEEGCRVSTWKDGSVRTDHPVFGGRVFASSVHQSSSHLVNLAYAMDTLFPPSQEPG